MKMHSDAEARRYFAKQERDDLKNFFADTGERDVSLFYQLKEIKERSRLGINILVAIMLLTLACLAVLALILWRVW